MPTVWGRVALYSPLYEGRVWGACTVPCIAHCMGACIQWFRGTSRVSGTGARAASKLAGRGPVCASHGSQHLSRPPARPRLVPPCPFFQFEFLDPRFPEPRSLDPKLSKIQIKFVAGTSCMYTSFALFICFRCPNSRDEALCARRTDPRTCFWGDLRRPRPAARLR